MTRSTPSTRRPGRPTKRSNPTQTRTTLLEAALDRFAARGFDAVTTAEIARHAKVTPPLLHYYFDSKETLWQEAVTQAFARMQQDFAETTVQLRNSGPDTRLRELIRQFVRFSARHPQLPRIILQEGNEATPRLDWLVTHCLKPLHDLFEGAADEAIDAGFIPRSPAPNLVFAIIGASTLFFTIAPVVNRLYGVNPFSEEEIERQASTVVDAIYAKENSGSS